MISQIKRVIYKGFKRIRKRRKENYMKAIAIFELFKEMSKGTNQRKKKAMQYAYKAFGLADSEKPLL